MKQELDIARRLARAAGAILLDHYSRAPSVDWKRENDPVTSADHAASRFLVEELGRRYPDYGVLSEEADDDSVRLGRERVWIIDPMDGTKEFISRCDEFSVMIGLVVDGEARLGVVHQPTSGKTWYALSGEGAFMEANQRAAARLQVSSESDPARMTIALSRSHPSSKIDRLRRRLGITASIASGSLGLKVGLIAEGRAHLYLNTSARTYQWDTCAADVILKEAGGRMTDLSNVPFRYNRAGLANANGVVATNGRIHGVVVRSLDEAGGPTEAL